MTRGRYHTFTWSELHVLWQGTVRNLINLILDALFATCDDADECQVLLEKIDLALWLYARPLATVRGKPKSRGLSSMLAREGPYEGRRVCHTTKLDLYSLSLALVAIVQSTTRLPEDVCKAAALYLNWVRLTRNRDPETGEEQLSESQLVQSDRMLLRAVNQVTIAFPEYKCDTGKWHRNFEFSRITRLHGLGHQEDTGENAHKEVKNVKTNMKREEMQIVKCSLDGMGLRMGRANAQLRDTLLCHHVCSGNVKDAKLLLASGVPPTARDRSKTPAIVLASRAGSFACVELLLERRASIDARGPHNDSALTAACQGGHPQCLQLLLKAGAKALGGDALHGLLNSRSNQLTAGEWACVRAEAASAEARTARVANAAAASDAAARAARYVQCATHVSGCLGVEVKAPPPSRATWNRLDPRFHRLRPSCRTLKWDEVAVGSVLCQRQPFLRQLRKALHLRLAYKAPGEGQYGHWKDAACRVTDLPDLPALMPNSVDVHPGILLGSEAPSTYRMRVHALSSINLPFDARDRTAPRCAAFEGDGAFPYYYGILKLFFSLWFKGEQHEMCLVHWLIPASREFAGAEDAAERAAATAATAAAAAAAAGGEAELQEDGYGDDEEEDDEDRYDTTDEDEDEEEEDGEEEEAADDDGAASPASETDETDEDEDAAADEDEDAAAGGTGGEAAGGEVGNCKLTELVYALLPASQRDRDEARRKKRRRGQQSYATRNFYEVVPVSEILFSVPIWPAKLDSVGDMYDPKRFLLNEYGWGL